MKKTSLPLLAVTLAFALTALPLGAMAQAQHDDSSRQKPQVRKVTPQGTGQVNAPKPQGRVGTPAAQGATGPQQGARIQSVGRGPGGQPARLTQGALPRHDFRGQAFRGRLAWERGRWRHERYNGRLGWWWDVGGIRYFYPERVDGPPAYVSEVEYADAVYGDPDGPPAMVEDDAPPAPVVGYPPPPPPPGQDTVGGAVGGAILGGILGGIVSGRPGGAVAGALIGGSTGAMIASEGERRRGYYWWHGACYYRYPSGEYAGVPPGYCQ